MLSEESLLYLTQIRASNLHCDATLRLKVLYNAIHLLRLMLNKQTLNSELSNKASHPNRSAEQENRSGTTKRAHSHESLMRLASDPLKKSPNQI